MVRRKHSLEEEINWKITDINFSIYSILVYFIAPFITYIFFEDFILNSNLSYTTYSLTYQGIVSYNLAKRYSISGKTENLTSFSYILRFAAYFFTIWFGILIINLLLISSNSIEFLSEAVVQNLDYNQSQLLIDKNFDVESFKIIIEEIFILIVCNFGLLIYAILKLNKKQKKLIRK
ncbi:hypothetical protein OA176_00375 [Prochlorococcus sp. AH-716-P13]|nr:hypothetical protein [Prochlorococcus sp. AH-716-P13]